MDKKKNYVKGMSSDFAVSDPDDPTTNTVIKNPARAKYQTPFTKLYFSSYLKNAI